MAEVIDSITVRYDADITPYLRGLKRLESETEKSLSKLERQYGAQLDQISRRGAEVLSQISALAGTPLQIAVAQERASATSRRHPRGRRPRAPELTPESIRREHDEHRTPAQLAIDLIEFVEEIPRKLIEVFTFALKRLLVPLEGVDLRDFDLDIRLKELEILGKRIEENRKQLSVAEGMEVEKAARELLDNLRVFRSILSRAIVEFGARQGQLGKAADVDAPTTPTGAAKIAELIRLQNAILEFVETIGDPNLTKAVRDAIDAIGIGRGARGPGRPLPSRRTSDAPEVESRPSVSVPGRVPELLPPPPKPDRVPELLPPRPKPVPPILPPRPKPNREDGIDAGVPISRGGERDGGFIQPAAFRFEDSAVDGAEVDLAAIDRQAAAWQGVLDRLDKVPPALARTRRETLDVDRAVRDLGFTFASAFEDAIVSGASLSDILQGLERDILRILTRLLVTEPLARGLTAGLGSFTGGGRRAERRADRRGVRGRLGEPGPGGREEKLRPGTNMEQ